MNKILKSLSKNDTIIVKNYETKSTEELMKLTKLNMADYRGRTASLSKKGLILTKATLKKINAPKNTYTNDSGVMKNNCRNVIIDDIIDSGLTGTVLSLPFETCVFERSLLKKSGKNFNFVGVEKNELTYKKMLITSVRENIDMECIHGDFSDVIKKGGQYDHIFADWCSQVNSLSTDIKTILNNKMVKVGGIFAFTVQNRAHEKKNGVLKLMNSLNPVGLFDNKHVENGIRTFVLKESGYNFSLERVVTYKDDEKQAMIMILLKRVK